MKFKHWFLLFSAFIFIACGDQNTEPEVGEIIERTPEEVASFKDYAPEFTFVSIDGQDVSLTDLKGKYVYIDIWATWCKPCLDQIPAMKEMEGKYRDTDIEFVSISVDKERDMEKWRRMVNDKDMSGLQLFAGSGGTFHRDYKISTIPKFVLIGKDGEIITDNAPRPMDYRTGELNPQLMTLLDKMINDKS